MSRRVVIAAGGTGGHLFPAQALADDLSDCEILFMGGGLASNPFFSKERACVDISYGASPRSLHKIIKGTAQSIGQLRRFRPDLIVGFGSYHTFPVLAAARLLRIPSLLHEANALPGKVVRWFSKKAELVGVHFPGAVKRLKGNVCQIPLPLRAGEKSDKEAARRHFGLDPNTTTVLVLGGSQGALPLNETVPQALIATHHPLQVIHLTGEGKTIGRIYQQGDLPSYVAPFEERVDLAWQASDLTIMRAGASACAESVQWEVPSIMVPYPYGDRHQEWNAKHLEEIGGGEVLLQSEMTLTGLASLVDQVIERRSLMVEALQKSKNKEPKTLAERVREYL